MPALTERFLQKLHERKDQGNLRSLRYTEGLQDFCSNDYLGLARDSTLQTHIHEQLVHQAQPLLGATGSRLVSGHHAYIESLEHELAALFEAEACLIFNSGYQANSALLATVPQKGDTILCDELIHASLREGARLSFAQKYYFKHNDLEDLARKIQQAEGEVFVVIESVYSMDGDFGLLAEIQALCQAQGAHLIIDEAHSTGIFGEKGVGLAQAQGLHKQSFARVYTFGKALGGHGACIVGSRLLIDYLINFARAFIYTTALPMHSLVAIREGFAWIAAHPELAWVLQEKIRYFKASLQELPPGCFLKEGDAPIQIVRIGGNAATKAVALGLQQAGFDVRAILAPTVKAGEEILRICLHSFNSEADIAALAKEIAHLTQNLSKDRN